MARKPRDHKAEYARRLELGRKRGYSRARARGHSPLRKKKPKRESEELKERLELAFALFRESKNLSKSAKTSKVSTERFRLFLRENSLARKRNGQWRLLTDERPRQIEMLSVAGWVAVTVRGLKLASEIGKHRAAVRAFKDSGDVSALAPFVSKSITDIDGKTHPFETRPNMLLRSFKTGRGSFEQIYKLVSQ